MSQDDGKIIIVGDSKDAGASDFAISRHNLDGSLDLTFGVGGRVTTDFGRDDLARAVALDSQGRIVVAGNAGSSFAIARYLFFIRR